MLLPLHPENPQTRNIRMLIECLQDGGVVIYPTDTIYGLGCDIMQHRPVERICRIKQVDPAKAQLSLICHDLSDLSRYTKSIDTPLYRMLRSHLPGPYTFILPASKQVPKMLKSKKNTIGLRIPDNHIARSIVRELGRPILSASLPGAGLSAPLPPPSIHASVSRTVDPDPAPVEEYTDPERIHEVFGNQVDIVVDGGIGGILPSTVIDCTSEPWSLVRQGAGEWGQNVS